MACEEDVVPVTDGRGASCSPEKNGGIECSYLTCRSPGQPRHLSQKRGNGKTLLRTELRVGIQKEDHGDRGGGTCRPPGIGGGQRRLLAPGRGRGEASCVILGGGRETDGSSVEIQRKSRYHQSPGSGKG